MPSRMMRNDLKRTLIALAVAGLASGAARGAHADTTLSIATLAPDGSSWMKLFHAFDKEVQAKTGGQVRFKFFPGGIAGDEKDTVRKMRGGSLDGAAITAVGLGQIAPQVRILELPFLFHDDGELDYVRGKLAPRLQKAFSDAGFHLVSWGDVGWVYLWSNIPITGRADLDKTKMWAWTDDPVVRDLFTKLSVTSVPLGVPDVYTSLQTGLIDSCYGSPLATLALQWYTKVKYVTKQPISMSIGAVVLTNDAYNKLTPDQRAAVDAAAADLEKASIQQIRRDNAAALRILLRHGITQVDEPASFISDMTAQSKAVWTDMAGQLYPRSLLDQVQGLLKEYRASHGG